jgi:hypothetical protein
LKPICRFADCKWAFSFFDDGHLLMEGDRLMKRLTLLVAIVLIVLPAFADEKRFSVPLGDSPALGPPGAPVTIIEFLDFQ